MLNSGETTLPNLPEEIILDILYRLPVRSLLRFRCVCKSWRSRISSTDFAESHLQMSVRSPNLNSRLLIISPSYVKSINHHELSPPFITTEHDHPLGNAELNVYVLGSCNGLVCLDVNFGESIMLYNPSTRHYRLIPTSESFSHVETLRYSFRGFFFDPDLHEYKVVRDTYNDEKFEVELFSIKDDAHQPNTVRRMSCDFVQGLIHSTLLFNGSLHLLVYRHHSFHGQMKNVIVRLDFAREVFDEVPEPDVCKAKDLWATLKVFGGCLSLVSTPQNPFSDSIEFWVMKEYAVKTSWTKLLSIPTTRYLSVMPINFKSPREILSVVCTAGRRRMLSIYNSEERSFKKVFTHRDPRWFETAVYVESLISP